MKTVPVIVSSPGAAAAVEKDKPICAMLQILAHVGGITKAFVRHHPVNWAFHWRGICRAISSRRSLNHTTQGAEFQNHYSMQSGTQE
jgi:hypothetical protein